MVRKSQVRSKQRLTIEEKLAFDQQFENSNPRPYIQLTSIADSSKSVEQVEDFSLVKSVSVRAYKTNNEDYDSDEALLNLHKSVMDKMKGESGEILYKNNKAGLNKEEVKALVSAATATSGNASYKVHGLSQDGHTITRTESDSKIQLNIPVPESYTIADVAKSVFQKLHEISGNPKMNISNPNITNEEVTKAKKIVETLKAT